MTDACILDSVPCSSASYGTMNKRIEHLSTKVAALEECLSRSGILSAQQVEVQMHRLHFQSMCKMSQWIPNSELKLVNALHKANCSSEIATHLDPGSSRALARTCTEALSAMHALVSRLYVFGGSMSNRGVATTLEFLDVTRSAWQVLPHTVPPVGGASAVLDGRIYFFGMGLGGIAGRVLRLDPRQQPKRAWKICLGPHHLRIQPALAVLGGQLYVCGGLSPSSGKVLSSAERFCPTSGNPWECLPPMNEMRFRAASAPFAGQLLVCGGSSISGLQGSRSAEMYCPISGAWCCTPPMVARRSGHCASLLGPNVYVCGGFDKDGPLQSVEFFGAGQDAWRALPSMRIPRGGCNSAVIGRKLFVFGGATAGVQDALSSSTACVENWDHPHEVTASVECFDPAHGIWELQAPMITGRWGHVTGVLSASCLEA